MQHSKTRRRITRLGAAAALLALLGAACSSSKKSSSTSTTGSTTSASGNTASAPGITANQITIGSHQPLTGPAAPGYSEIAPAANAYFQYVNAHGGVHGRKIVYKYLDDGYNPTNTTTDVRQLVLQDGVFAIFNGLGTPTHLSVLNFLNSQKVPDLFVASGCTCWNKPSTAPYTFGYQTDYTIEGEIQGQYIAKNFAGKKIGYFVQNDDFGTGGVKGLDTQIPKASVVSRQTYVPTNINIKPQIIALQQAGAQVIASYSIPAFTALELLAAAQLNYHPTFVVSNVGSDITTLTALLQNFSKGAAGGSLLEGMVSDTYLPPIGDSTNSWVQLFKRIHDEFIPTLPLDGNVEYGMGSAYVFVQALLAAGQNPTRDGIVKAVENNGFSGPGLVPFSYSATNHQGYSGVQMGSIKTGQFHVSGQPETATDTGGIQAYTTPPAAPPVDGIPTS